MKIGQIIPKHAKSCFLNGEIFKEGDAFYSAIVEGEELERFDLCESCFSQWQKSSAFSAITGYWKTTLAKKIEKPKTPDELAFAEFKRVAISEDLYEQKVAYFLANYLKRCGQLVHRRFFHTDAPDRTVYEDLATSEVFLVKRVNYSSQELETVRSQLENLFTLEK